MAAIDGTNNYNVSSQVPAEVIVSRTLQAKNRNWSNIIWRQGKPALDSEWNLLNDIVNESQASYIRSQLNSGWLELGFNKYPIGNSGVANEFAFYTKRDQSVLDYTNVIVNGWPLLVGGTNNIDTSLNSVILNAAGSVARTDFVFLEVWRAEVRSLDENNNPLVYNKPDTTHVYAYGNTQFGGTNFTDDLVDYVIKPTGIETSERVQIQYRIRVSDNVTFINEYGTGFDNISVQGRGANSVPQISGYQFMNMAALGDAGLWRCGTGDEASRVALKSVDGYVYAIPMFRVSRRSNVAYADWNTSDVLAIASQQGNSTVMSSLISDRIGIDGKFNDGIDATDIMDMRLKTSVEQDYKKIIEMNMNELFSGRLQSSYNPIIQYDSICEHNVNGYTNFLSGQGCSGKRQIWSDAQTTQINMFALVATNTITQSTSPDAWRSAGGSGVWADGSVITVKVAPKYPTNTALDSVQPAIYLEEKNQAGQEYLHDISTEIDSTPSTILGAWTQIDETEWQFEFNGNITSPENGLNVWIYYTLIIPVGQGISYVPDKVYSVDYMNYTSFGTGGKVVRGNVLLGRAKLEVVTIRFSDILNHCYDNTTDNEVFSEVVVKNNKKQLNIRPLITTNDGTNRTLAVATIDPVSKTIILPFPIQHLKGIYTQETGGIELATTIAIPQYFTNLLPDGANYTFFLSDNFINELTSLQYDPSGQFSGGQTELLVASGGVYKPVYQHFQKRSMKGTVVKLFTTNNDRYVVPSVSATKFKFAGRTTRIRSGSGYGYDLNTTFVNCSSSTNAVAFSTIPVHTNVYVDMDYLGAPHSGAELRIPYLYTPYQGASIGNRILNLLEKRDTGIFTNNGTAGAVSTNKNYLQLSYRTAKLTDDFLKDGSAIENINGNDTDTLFYNRFELLPKYDSGLLWNTDDFTLPLTIDGRGFKSLPLFECSLVLPSNPQINQNSMLFMLVKDKMTHEVYLFVQVGDRTGDQYKLKGQVQVDIYRLKEKLIIK